ncbi:MAG: M23 family metallopeptidase [Solirubrobacterales bacterium]
MEAMNPRPTKPHARKAAALIGWLALLLGLATPAAALDGPGGGLPVPNPPRISDVICLTDCLALRTASVGSKVQVSGSDMGQVRSVSFKAANGRLRTPPESVTETSITAIVPPGTTAGTLRVIATGGAVSDHSPERLGIGPRPAAGTGSPRLLDVKATPERAYLFGVRKPTLDFVLGGVSGPTDLRIDLVTGSSTVVASEFMRGVLPNQSVQYRWNGRSSSGKAAPPGRYSFSISTASGEPLRGRADRDGPASGLSFQLYGFVFPVPAPHTYGDGIGAGRGHQGVDVLADCGKPLLAARGGRVYWNDYQASGAGHYLVINLAGTGGQSHVYMHLTEPSPLRKGTFVRTGQRIGTVGTTGRSTACHLHFEHWSAPGWYQGGTFLDPTSQLKAWDRYS